MEGAFLGYRLAHSGLLETWSSRESIKSSSEGTALRSSYEPLTLEGPPPAPAGKHLEGSLKFFLDHAVLEGEGVVLEASIP